MCRQYSARQLLIVHRQLQHIDSWDNLPADCHSIADLWWHSAAVRRVQLGAQCRNRSECLDPKLLYTTQTLQYNRIVQFHVCQCGCGQIIVCVCVGVSCSLCIESRHQTGQAETDREAGGQAGRHTHQRTKTHVQQLLLFQLQLQLLYLQLLLLCCMVNNQDKDSNNKPQQFAYKLIKQTKSKVRS